MNLQYANCPDATQMLSSVNNVPDVEFPSYLTFVLTVYANTADMFLC